MDNFSFTISKILIINGILYEKKKKKFERRESWSDELIINSPIWRRWFERRKSDRNSFSIHWYINF